MSFEDFKRTVRTVQLGFFLHDATDPIVNIPCPQFRDTGVSGLPNHDTRDYLRESPRLYPNRSDKGLEDLSRRVLVDLFWMCCCRGAALASVEPNDRRHGGDLLRRRIQAVIDDVMRPISVSPTGNGPPPITPDCVLAIAGALGAPLGQRDASDLASSAGGATEMADAICEPCLGDCGRDTLLILASKFANRAARAMHFLTHQGMMADGPRDELLLRLRDDCLRLIALAEPGARISGESSRWVLELFTGVPRNSTCRSCIGAPSPPNWSIGGTNFSGRRSILVPYVPRATDPEREMFSNAIQGTKSPVQVTNLPRPPSAVGVSSRAVCVSPRGDTGLSPLEMRLAGCSPALTQWFDSPRVRSGKSSQRLRLTMQPFSSKSQVSNSEFARLCTPTSQHVLVPPSPPVAPPVAAIDDRQGRRDMQRLRKSLQCARELTLGVIDELRGEMQSILAHVSAGRYAGVNDKLLCELEELKVKLDDAFGNSNVMRNLAAGDRTDLLERTVFLAKLIGEQRRVVAEQAKVNRIWDNYTSSSATTAEHR